MIELKKCSKCHKEKDPRIDFYLCAGRWRSECKACTIKRNVLYQRELRVWRCKYGDDSNRRDYMRDYYSKNLEKFAHYREEFRERHPGYYQEYAKKQKEKK